MTSATARVAGFPADKLVGQTVEAVEAQGKHLLVRLDSGQVLHSHLRMAGSWHVYREGDRWRRPETQARLTLACGDHLAVCFNAPVVELLQPRAEALHPGLTGLGPDILADPLDVDEIRRRARDRPPDTPLGDLLLDQRVAAGIGNIWRAEALFATGHSPWKPQSALTDDQLDDLYRAAHRLMRTQLGTFSPMSLRREVYNRAGRPCRRCGRRVESRRHGDLGRVAYWCPGCQA